MNKIFPRLCTSTLLVVSSHTMAANDLINERQNNQHNRIAQGVVTGEITRGEATKLGIQQYKIVRKEARFKSDGVLTKRERAKLQYSLNKSSSNINKKKNNDRVR